ncbi:acetyl-CoA C-acetyltransferase [Comamonadaceae bacterium G21597-S1]|nr:acetyl-CoA C-acetyltransferase [Comamonadaceae bacterium G21597-S1]
MSPPTIYIVDALRAAGGRRKGRLAAWHPVDLAAAVLDALVQRNDIDPPLIDDVIMGCVSQAGQQSSNVARNAVLASRLLPESVPGTTVDRQCGSSQQALQFAAQAVASGMMDVVVAAGVEHMSRVPMGIARTLPDANGLGNYRSPGLLARYPDMFSQFTGAEMMARKYALGRDTLDAYALESHRRAAAATRSGHFEREIVPLAIDAANGNAELHRIDEGIRFDASAQALAAVKPIEDGGLLTAASSSQICDGASAVLVANDAGLKKMGAQPLARLHASIVLGHDPVIMLEAPIPATTRVLARAGLTLQDIDLFEVNEAFASVPLAWLQALNADPSRLNVHGGAIALGHPLGASGTKLTATLVSALHRHGKRWGLLTMCESGGMANASIFERL